MLGTMWKSELADRIGDSDLNNLYVSLLAFMDDTYLVATSYQQTQIMINELMKEFGKAGLFLKHSKLKYMSENCKEGSEGGQLFAGRVPIKRVQELKVLGSVITSFGDEEAAYAHRVKASWACYNKWKHVLECSASMASRLSFWMITVGRSMLYSLATTRHEKHNAEHLAVIQRNMVRRMMRLKRKPIAWIDVGNGAKPKVVLEQWVDWQIRSLRAAKQQISSHDMSITDKLQEERLSWAKHVGRFGLSGKPRHILKDVVLWRCRSWWQTQQLFNSGHFTRIVHAPRMGQLKRWEWSLPYDWWSG